MILKIRQTFITLIFFMNEKQEGFELNPLMGSSPAEGHSFKGRTEEKTLQIVKQERQGV